MLPILNPKLRMKQVVLLNGPPRSGKDTVAHIICSTAAHGPWVHDKFAVELKERCHAAYRLYDSRSGLPVHHNYFEKQKDVPLQLFEGLTPRRAYIEFYEKWVAPVCGKDALGRWLVERVGYFMFQQEKNLPAAKRNCAMVISDAGTPEAVQKVVDRFGTDACTLINIERDGCTFEGDSRKKFEIPGIRTCTLRNPGDTVESLLAAVRAAAPHLYIEIATQLPA